MGVTLTSRLKSCLLVNSLLSPFLLYFIFSFTLSHLPTPLKYIILLSECLSPSALLLQSLAILFFSHSLFLSFSLPRLSLHSPFSFNFSVLSSPCHTFLLSCSASLSMNLCQPQRHTFPPCVFMIPTLSPSGVHP